MSRFLISIERLATDRLSVIVNDADPRIADWLSLPVDDWNPHDLLRLVDGEAVQVEGTEAIGLLITDIEELPPCSS